MLPETVRTSERGGMFEVRLRGTETSGGSDIVRDVKCVFGKQPE